MSTVYFIIAQQGFRDEELFEPLEIVKEAGYTPIILSQEAGLCKGSKGGEVTADFAISDAKLDGVAGIFVIGGPGSVHLIDVEELGTLLDTALSQHILIGAICYGPMILAHFGIIDGMHATVYADKLSLGEFKKHNVMYIGQDVVEDEWLITANGPHAAQQFGKHIVGILQNGIQHNDED
jgi:protease I